jgi:predicted PurR-regulated permease PerM
MSIIEYNEKRDNLFKINKENKRIIYFFKRVSNMSIYIFLIYINIKLFNFNIIPSLIISGIISPIPTLPIYNNLINKEEKQLQDKLEIIYNEYKNSQLETTKTIENNNITTISPLKQSNSETINQKLVKAKRYPY